MRGIPTTSAMTLHAVTQPAGSDPAIRQTVYIIPLSRFGCIRGKKMSGNQTVYLVQHTSKSDADWVSFTAADLVLT